MNENIGPYELDSIYPGECSRLMASLPDGCIDLTVTSPPYDNLRTYNGYEFAFEAIAEQLWRVTKMSGVVVWVVSDATVNGSETGTSFRQALYFMKLGFDLHDTMFYAKENYAPIYPSLKRYAGVVEFMFIFSKGLPKTFNPIQRSRARNRKEAHAYRQQDGSLDRKVIDKRKTQTKNADNLWVYSVAGNSSTDAIAYEHPAIFPEALARDHILSWSNPGDLVLDPMCGSGTTCKMAKENGRRWLGFDISPEYVELARRRVEGGRIPLFTLQPNGAINA